MADLRIIRVIRQEKGFTLVELARKAKLSHGYIADLEKGVKKNPSMNTLESISKALGITLDELVNGIKE